MMTLMTNGGPLMWLILFNGLLAIGIFFERLLSFHRAQIHTADWINGIRNALVRGNVTEAVATCNETAGPVAKVVKAALLNFDRPREEIREAVQDVARGEIVRLERNLPIMATLAQVTPLIGFLGTVTGMIKIFKLIQAVQLANPGQMAGGIWEALLTTAGGLVVAIPTYVAYNYMVSRVQTFVLDMEQSANDIVTFLTRRNETTNEALPIVLTEDEKK